MTAPPFCELGASPPWISKWRYLLISTILNIKYKKNLQATVRERNLRVSWQSAGRVRNLLIVLADGITAYRILADIISSIIRNKIGLNTKHFKIKDAKCRNATKRRSQVRLVMARIVIKWHFRRPEAPAPDLFCRSCVQPSLLGKERRPTSRRRVKWRLFRNSSLHIFSSGWLHVVILVEGG